MSVMYSNIYYDRRKGIMHLREISDNKSVKLDIPNEFYFYQEDTSKTSKVTDAYGMHVNRKNFSSYQTMKEGKARAKALGLKTCETDMQEEVKFLQNRYLGVELVPDIRNINICYIDIEIAGGQEFPEPAEAKYPINLITVKDTKTSKINTFGLDRYTGKLLENSDFTYRYFAEEKDLLENFVEWFRKQKFDVISGWNSSAFDIHYIVNRCRRLGIDKHLSPFNIEIEEEDEDRLDFVHDDNSEEDELISGKSKYYKLPGINLLDYMELYKNFTFETRERYSLQFISMFELKEGKLDLDGQINNIYKTNWNQFVEYNIQDVLLVEKLEKKLRFIELAYILSHQSLIPVERIMSSIAIWDGYIMRDLRLESKIMPDREQTEDWYVQEGHHILPDGSMVNLKEGETVVAENYVKGGYVEAHPGFHKWVIARDFASLYPHMIMQFNISPECLICFPSEEVIKEKNLIRSTMPGVYYLRHEDHLGVMTKIVKKVYKERVDFKDLMYAARDVGDNEKYIYYKSQQHIRKILLNSLYGVSCNAGFHFFNLQNARSITRGGRVLIKHMSNMANKYFTSDDWNKTDRFVFYPNSLKNVNIKKNIVSLIDTDSSYIVISDLHKQNNPTQEPLDFCLEFNKNVLDPFFETCLEMYAEEYNAPQIHNFEIEKIIEKQLVQAKKKYLIALKWDEGKTYEVPLIKATGIEIKKSDTPLFCRKNLEKVVDLIFNEKVYEEVTDYIIEVKKEFEKQKIEDIGTNKSVNGYKKYALPTASYIKNGISYAFKTPVHVRAAINHNYMVKKLNLQVFEICNGTKAKYIYIKNRNILNQDVVGFVGTFPKEFENYFQVDFDAQFEATFLRIVQRFFTALGWGEISLKRTKINKFLE